MPDEERQLKKRLEELAARAEARACYTSSEFLTLAEQAALESLHSQVPYTLEGGYAGAERKLAWFGDETLCGYEAPPPIACLCIAPVAPKFAETLTHRDFLGALMGLGIRREVLGDLILHEGRAYLLCLDSIAAYVAEQLTEVRHTAVSVSPAECPPETAVQLPPLRQIVVASERLDAVVAAVYNLSRAESQRLLMGGRVFVGGREMENAAYAPRQGDIISVRGHSRFRYEGVERETRKGRLRADVRVYGENS
jgi:RNA-binding protein YlmH